MGNRSSIISLTKVPGPRSKYADVYEYLESKGCQFTDLSNNFLEMKCPIGWSMFRYYEFDNKFYLFDGEKVGQAIFYEFDNDKYSDYRRTASLWKKNKELPFTYPLPDFYVSKDGYLEIDPNSDMFREIKFVKKYTKTYNTYLKDYHELTDRQTMFDKLLQDRDKILKIANTPFLKEHGKTQQFLVDLQKSKVLPLSLEEIVQYMTEYYSGLLGLKNDIIVNGIQNKQNDHLGELYNQFFYMLKYRYDSFFTCTTDIERWYQTNETYLKLPDTIFVVKDNKAIAESKALAEFEKLYNEYYQMAEYVSGCGSRFQGQLDTHYEKLKTHITNHPELNKKMPDRIISRNDGSGGLATGLSRLVQY